MEARSACNAGRTPCQQLHLRRAFKRQEAAGQELHLLECTRQKQLPAGDAACVAACGLCRTH
jgi:hypothetical protein